MRRVFSILLAASLWGPAPVVTVEDTAEAGVETAASGTVPAPAGRRPAAAGRGSLVLERPERHVARIGCGDPSDSAVPSILLGAALRDCRREGDLKVIVDLPIGLQAVTATCARERFRYSRSVRREGRFVHEFYADLYSAET